VEDDLVHPPAGLVEGAENRRVLVRLGGQIVELAAGDLAHFGEVRACALESRGLHHRLAQELEVPVLQVKVHPTRGRHPVLRRLRVLARRAHRGSLVIVSAYLNSGRRCQPAAIAFAAADD
jgi:hypothetical protein